MSTNYTHWSIRARLKTRQLLLLVALEEEGNINRAAQMLSMTQPAASKLLKDLEETLGVQLFDRLPRGMRATWYGETMIRHARMALASLSAAHDEIEALKAGRFGQVSVGAITAPGMTLLPAAVAQVKEEHPSLRISLQIETSDVLMERLAQGKLDMVIGRLFERHDKSDLRYEALVEEPVSAIARPGHPLLAVPKLTLRDLVSPGWIVPAAGSVLRHRFELMFQEEGLDAPVNLVETSALLFLTKMLQQSDLLGVVASDVARYYAEHGMVALLPIQLPCKMDAFGLITRSDKLLSPAAKVMLRALKNAALAIYGTQLDMADVA
ncbi:MAG TPA: LysR family transcriptional regulator [Ideonella sp.]|uniref:LysR family transcriptional regulator n=1 Tax=Ideonella sp. TaxID=1929293 RepID=UPI002E30F541|nr:LysR family transcriptional regulator [Ideonella sp.]HEX5687822.1 LysR family transcriptional regulator [Ideonella sp.]